MDSASESLQEPIYATKPPNAVKNGGITQSSPLDAFAQTDDEEYEILNRKLSLRMRAPRGKVNRLDYLLVEFSIKAPIIFLNLINSFSL